MVSKNSNLPSDNGDLLTRMPAENGLKVFLWIGVLLFKVNGGGLICIHVLLTEISTSLSLVIPQNKNSAFFPDFPSQRAIWSPSCPGSDERTYSPIHT